MIKEAKEMATSPPLPPSASTETSSIHTCTQTMLLVVCPKSTWLHSRRNPFYNRSRKVNIICTPRLFFFSLFFFSQTTIICFESKSSFLTSLCYSEDALGYKAGRDTNTKEGPLRGMWRHTQQRSAHQQGSSLLHFAFHSGKITPIQTTNPLVFTF